MWWKFGLDLRDNALAHCSGIFTAAVPSFAFVAAVHRFGRPCISGGGGIMQAGRQAGTGSFSAGVSDLAPAAAADAAADATQREEMP